MEEGALALWPSNINLRARDVEPAQAALVTCQGSERCVKGRRYLRHVSTTHMSDSEPPDDASKFLMKTSKPRVAGLPRDKSGGVSRSGQAVFGV